jgi:hypothetical protein
MLEVTDRDSSLLGDVLERDAPLLAGDAQAFADRRSEQLVLVRFRHSPRGLSSCGGPIWIMTPGVAPLSTGALPRHRSNRAGTPARRV